MEYRPFCLAREWVKLGHQVTIVAASYSHLRTQAPKVSGTMTREQIEGIQYIWLRTPSYRGNGIGRVLNMLVFIGQLLRYQVNLVHDGKPDAVIASSTYPLDIVPAYCIAKRARAKLIFEVHDLWPLSVIELGGISPWHPFVVALQWAENFAYRNADCVVSILPKAEGHMREHGMDAQKFAYIPNGIDVEDWRSNRATIPRHHQDALSSLKQAGYFVVGYVGAHGLANALHTLIDSASLLQMHPVAFVLVGQGPEKEKLQEKAQQSGLAKVIFLPPVPKSSIPALLAPMDALYIGLKKEPVFRFGVSPNKLLDYMMAAKPVIHGIEAANDLVAESGCGISVPAENPAAVAEAIVQLMNMSSLEREEMGLRGREYVLTHHDYRVLAKRFAQILRKGNQELGCE